MAGAQSPSQEPASGLERSGAQQSRARESKGDKDPRGGEVEEMHRQQWTWGSGDQWAGASALPSSPPSHFCSAPPSPPQGPATEAEIVGTEGRQREAEGLTVELTSRAERR